MTIIDAIDALEYCGYRLGDDHKGLYIYRPGDGDGTPPCHNPSLRAALDNLASNKEAVTYYYSGIYP